MYNRREGERKATDSNRDESDETSRDQTNHEAKDIGTQNSNAVKTQEQRRTNRDSAYDQEGQEIKRISERYDMRRQWTSTSTTTTR